MREIGSEFWLDDLKIREVSDLEYPFKWGDDRRFLFTGRTAIDYVLQDIQESIENVYMPSYCCDSMLQPFIDRNINIEFYDVKLNDTEGLSYEIDYEKKIDIFFATSYFGFCDTIMDSIIGKFKSRNIIVIEDNTHRLLSAQSYCEKADYLVASLRKWFEIPSGGLAVKISGTFKEQHLNSPRTRLINNRIEAMNLKADYINDFNNFNDEEKKNSFLNLFSEFNSSLNKDYKGILIDNLSKQILSRININEIKQTRQGNAKYLYENLKESKFFRFLINEPNFNEDCPLFVPLLVQEDLRDPLRKYLISKDIFCPVHWPVPRNVQLSGEFKKVYIKELSLICDQRYSSDDMKRITSTIGEFIDLL